MTASILRHLPGFRVTADRVRQELEAGTSVIVSRPDHGPDGVAAVLVEEAGLLTAADRLPWSAMDVTSKTQILDALWEFYGNESAPPGASISDFMNYDVSGWRIGYGDLPAERAATEWLDFMSEYAKLASITSHQVRATFLLSLPSSALASGATLTGMPSLRVIPWEDTLTELDSSVLGKHLAIDDEFGGPIWQSMKASAISSLAGKDVMFAEALSGWGLLEFDELEDLIDAIRNRYGLKVATSDTVHDPSKSMLPMTQADRPTDEMSAVDHSTTELRRRIWRAQSEALYPHIEHIRWEALRRYRELMSVPHRRPNGHTIDALEDLEFGDIIFQLKRAREPRLGPAIERLEYLRKVRNSLAHFQAVPFEDLSRNRRFLEAWGG